MVAPQSEPRKKVANFCVRLRASEQTNTLLQTTKQQEGDLECMNNKCNAVANSPNDDACGVTVGSRKEGVAILWNTKFDRYITPQKYDYDWVVSIEISHDYKKMYIFNV